MLRESDGKMRGRALSGLAGLCLGLVLAGLPSGAGAASGAAAGALFGLAALTGVAKSGTF